MSYVRQPNTSSASYAPVDPFKPSLALGVNNILGGGKDRTIDDVRVDPPVPSMPVVLEQPYHSSHRRSRSRSPSRYYSPEVRTLRSTHWSQPSGYTYVPAPPTPHWGRSPSPRREGPLYEDPRRSTPRSRSPSLHYSRVVPTPMTPLQSAYQYQPSGYPYAPAPPPPRRSRSRSRPPRHEDTLPEDRGRVPCRERSTSPPRDPRRVRLDTGGPTIIHIPPTSYPTVTEDRPSSPIWIDRMGYDGDDALTGRARSRASRSRYHSEYPSHGRPRYPSRSNSPSRWGSKRSHHHYDSEGSRYQYDRPRSPQFILPYGTSMPLGGVIPQPSSGPYMAQPSPFVIMPPAQGGTGGPTVIIPTGNTTGYPTTGPSMVPQAPIIVQTSGTPEMTWLAITLSFFLDVIPRQFYLHLLLRFPSLYFSRVTRIFHDADMSMGEIKRMALEVANSNEAVKKELLYQGIFPQESATAPISFINLRDSWQSFIDSLMREWETLNIISVLLLSAILTILQIDTAAANPVSRFSALLSLICAFMSLLYGCIYIIRFGSMRKTHKAAEWANESEKTSTSIFWNVWVMLAMPAVWLGWSMIFFIACMMAFVWQTGTGTDADAPSETATQILVPRIVITAVLGLGFLYLVLIGVTFRKYSDPMEQAWQERIKGWLEEKMAAAAYSSYGYPNAYPSSTSGSSRYRPSRRHDSYRPSSSHTRPSSQPYPPYVVPAGSTFIPPVSPYGPTVVPIPQPYPQSPWFHVSPASRNVNLDRSHAKSHHTSRGPPATTKDKGKGPLVVAEDGSSTAEFMSAENGVNGNGRDAHIRPPSLGSETDRSGNLTPSEYHPPTVIPLPPPAQILPEITFSRIEEIDQTDQRLGTSKDMLESMKLKPGGYVKLGLIPEEFSESENFRRLWREFSDAIATVWPMVGRPEFEGDILWPMNQPAFLEFLRLLDGWNQTLEQHGVFVVFVERDDYNDNDREPSKSHEYSLYLGHTNIESLAVIRSEIGGPPLDRYWRNDDDARVALTHLPKLAVVRSMQKNSV